MSDDRPVSAPSISASRRSCSHVRHNSVNVTLPLTLKPHPHRAIRRDDGRPSSDLTQLALLSQSKRVAARLNGQLTQPTTVTTCLWIWSCQPN